MSVVRHVIRWLPGCRHIAEDRILAGLGWFAAFAAAVNFGLLLPVAWPGTPTRAARILLYATALVILVISHRGAAKLERRDAQPGPSAGPRP